MVKDGRDALGWGNVTICNVKSDAFSIRLLSVSLCNFGMQDGMGLGNWTFALNDSDTPLAGKPMCSGSLFEFCKRQDDIIWSLSFVELSACLSDIACAQTTAT